MSHKFFKPIEDRFIRGLFAGLIAGIMKDIPDLFLCDLMKIKKLAFWDYTGAMIFNRIPKSFIDHLLGFGMEVAFSLGIGIIYLVVIIPNFLTKHYLVRGLIYGSACWFVLMSIVKLFHVSDLLTKDLFTPLATLLFSAGYGLMLAFLDRYFCPQKEKSSSW